MCVGMCVCVCARVCVWHNNGNSTQGVVHSLFVYFLMFLSLCLRYGVATIGRLLKITGLFCKRALQKRLYSAKETYNFKEPTSRSHPILSVAVVLVEQFVDYIPHCNTLQHTASHCSTLQHSATHCNTLATHCNTLQHTATLWLE